ncbi:hypothetical protein N9446_00060 [bacterium]|jgi:hypothetical protein|nr:hypothetical protein [bacterium]
MTDKQTITYDGIEYDVSDLDEKEAYMYAQVRVLRKRIADARFDLDQMVAAENAFSNALVNSLKKENTDATTD